MAQEGWKQVQAKPRVAGGRGGRGGGATSAGGFVRGAPANPNDNYREQQYQQAPQQQQQQSGGRGGRGGRGGFGGGGFHVAATSQGPNGSILVHDMTYHNSEALQTVIMKEKVLAMYPHCKIEVTSAEGEPDRNDVPMLRIQFACTGPQAKEAASSLRNRRIVKGTFILNDDGEFLAQRARTAAEKIQMVVSLQKQSRGGNMVRVSTIIVGGEQSTMDAAKMEVAATMLLTQGNQTQQLRGERKDRRDHHEDPMNDYQVVTGGRNKNNNNGREQLNANHYAAELAHADQLPPKDALNYLGRLVQHKVADGADSDYLSWLSFLYEVEVHGVLAELAEYELHGIRLKLSNHLKGVAIIKIEISSGIRPFTERRPSVMVEDDVLLYAQSQGRNAVFRAPIFNVMADEVWIHVDNLKPLDEKDKKNFAKDSTQSELLGHISHNTLFRVAFDPAPYVGRCKMLGNNAAKNHKAFRFLQKKDPGLAIPNLETLVSNTAARINSRQPARSSRGGRSFGGERGLQEDPHNGLGDAQRYAAQLVINPPEDVRKIFIEGPCGTGKTHTICHSVVNLLKSNPKARVLMLSPSHSASDVAGMRLVSMLDEIHDKTVLRVYPRGRHPLRVPEALYNVSNMRPKKPFSRVSHEDRFNMDLLQEEGYLTHQIVIGTLSAVGQIFKTTNDPRHQPFTHIFIDEVAQAAMVETLMGMSNYCDTNSVKFIFSGDEQQIGPRCYANACAKWLKKSACAYLPNSAVKVKLDVSYRQVPALAKMQSLLFYKGRLQTAEKMEKVGLDAWGGHNDNPHPLRFIHVGKPPQMVKSSLVNKAESNVILNCILSLRGELNVQLTDMIVFTQFREQRRALTSAFAMRGCKGVQVREIEEFHGDEKDVVIMSLVQEEEDENSYDRKQLNTAIGRTAKLCIIVGNGNMTMNSREPKWRELMGKLLEEKAVDGYDYAEEDFDDKCWEPQPARALVESIKEFVPQTRKEQNEGHFQRLTKDDVLANNMSYFVGTVAGAGDWEGKNNMFVRHRYVSGVDVALDEDETTGVRKDFIFDGDLVAVKVDEKLTRWRDVDLFRGPNMQVAFNQPDVYCPFESDKVTVTIEDFESCVPQVMSDSIGRPKQPTGKVVALLSQPQLPPLVGRVFGNSFHPLNRRFPNFQLSGQPRSVNDNDVVVAVLDRATGTVPKYNFLGHAPQPFALEEVLAAQVPRIPTGANKQLDMVDNSQVYHALAFRNGQCAFNAVQDGPRWWVECFVPPIAHLFANHPQFEAEAQSRGCQLWQSQIADFCEKRRVQLFAGYPEWSRKFHTAATTGEECLAMRIKFPALIVENGQPVPTTDPDTLLRQTRVNMVKVNLSQSDHPQMVQSRINLGHMAAYLQQERCSQMGEVNADLNQEHDNSVMTELESWTNYVSAILMVRTIPMHSLLVRQDQPQQYRDNAGLDRQRIERPEYWVPNQCPITRGMHAGTMFPVYANVGRPCDRYGDVLTQRLLLAACKLRTGNPLTKEESNLTLSIKKHAVWLNTMPLIYGEIVRD